MLLIVLEILRLYVKKKKMSLIARVDNIVQWLEMTIVCDNRCKSSRSVLEYYYGRDRKTWKMYVGTCTIIL